MRKNPVIGPWAESYSAARAEFDKLWDKQPGIKDAAPDVTIQWSDLIPGEIGVKPSLATNEFDGETDRESQIPAYRNTRYVETTEKIVTVIPSWKERKLTGKKTKTGKPAFRWIVHKERKVTETVTKMVEYGENVELMYRLIAREWSAAPGKSPPKGPIQFIDDDMGDAASANLEGIEDGDLD